MKRNKNKQCGICVNVCFGKAAVRRGIMLRRKEGVAASLDSLASVRSKQVAAVHWLAAQWRERKLY